MSARPMDRWELAEFYAILGIAGQNLVIDGQEQGVCTDKDSILVMPWEEPMEKTDGETA